MTEWTKESLDALIDGLEPKIAAPGEYSPEWISGFRIGEQALASAILASQPERVECPTDCKHGKWGHKFLPDGSGKPGWLTRQEIFRPYKSKFCPDCGQSLKGAGE